MTYRAVSCTHQPLRLKGKGAKVLFRIQGMSKSGSAGLLRSAWVWFCCSRDEMTDRFDFILPPLPFSTDSGLFFVSIFSPRITDGHEIKDIGWSRLFSLLIKLKKKNKKTTKLLHIRPDSYVQKTCLHCAQMRRDVASVLQLPLLTGVTVLIWIRIWGPWFSCLCVCFYVCGGGGWGRW